jgi:Flp pilus assembly protein TadB
VACLLRVDFRVEWMSNVPRLRTNQRIGIQSETEEQVEELVADISRLIRSVEPEQRSGLKELAETLLHEEISTIVEEKTDAGTDRSRARLSPLAPGILLIVLGMGFFLIVPLIGATLAFIGFVMAIWGTALSFLKK